MRRLGGRGGSLAGGCGKSMNNDFKDISCQCYRMETPLNLLLEVV